MKLPYEDSVTLLATAEHYAERNDMLQALLADPCIARFDPELRCYLTTDFSALGFAYVLCQSDSDVESLAAMRREVAGGPCEFLRPKSDLRL